MSLDSVEIVLKKVWIQKYLGISLEILSDTHTDLIMSSSGNDPFLIMKCFSLSLVILFVLKFNLLLILI